MRSSKTLYDRLVTADEKRDFYEIQCDPVDSRPTERTAFIFAYARSKAETRINSLTRAKRESRRIILDNCSISMKLPRLLNQESHTFVFLNSVVNLKHDKFRI